MGVDFGHQNLFGTHFLVQNKMGIGPMCNFSSGTILDSNNNNTHSAPTFPTIALRERKKFSTFIIICVLFCWLASIQ